MGLFLSVILPIMAVFASRFILQRIRPLDVRSLSAVSLYILSPALVFVSLFVVQFDSGYMIMLVFIFVLFYTIVILKKLLAKVFKWKWKTESASILATGFMNS